MRHILLWLAVLMIAGGMLFPGIVLSGAIDDGAKKADQSLNSAGQKVDSSTKGAQDATDAAGKKASKATKSGADKVGGFFGKTENAVEGWMKNLEKKMKD
jgi:hypothetical protein